MLSDPRQLRASLRLTLWLMTRFRISLPNVIGHAESLTSPYHRELYAPWRCQTHADWQHADMVTYRRDLLALAKSEHITLLRTGGPVKTSLRLTGRVSCHRSGHAAKTARRPTSRVQADPPSQRRLRYKV